MTGKSGLTFEINNALKLEMFFDSTIIMEADSLLDFDYIPKNTTITKLNEGITHDHDTKMTLGKVIFSRTFEVEVDQLEVLSDLKDIDVEEDDKASGEIGLWTNDLTIGENVTLEAPKIVLFANDSLKIKSGVTINSLVENECYTDLDGNKDLYQCMSLDKHIDTLTYEGLISYYNE